MVVCGPAMIRCQSGGHVYIEDLRKVRALRPPPTHSQPIVPPALGVVSTPLIASAWESDLQNHPDCEFAEFVFMNTVLLSVVLHNYAS